MTEETKTAVPAAAPASSPKTASKKADKPKKTAGDKKPKVAPTHPPVAQMVVDSIKALKERNGSSLQAIKKYMAANYKVDVEKITPFIKKFMKTAVEKKQLTQTKGKGASGSFKINKAEEKAAAKPKKVIKKAKSPTKAGIPKKVKKAEGEKKTPKKVKTVTEKKAKSPSKKVKSDKPKAEKKAKSPAKKATKPKAEKKTEKTVKSPAKKGKADKPKKVATPKKAGATKK